MIIIGGSLLLLFIGLQVCMSIVTALGVLCCFALFVCLTLLASFFLPSHLSFKNMLMRDAERRQKEARNPYKQKNKATQQTQGSQSLFQRK